MLVEGAWLMAARRWSLADASALLLPGALMVIALRLALTGADWPGIALALAASAPVHIWDVRRRLSVRNSISDRR